MHGIRRIPSIQPSWLLIRHASTSTTPPVSPSASPAEPSVSRRRRRNASSHPSDGAEALDLIAPPDPVSNIRPVIYGSSPSARHRTPNSPYSTGEFPGAAAPSRTAELELEWRLKRERVDAMNHRFWAQTNQEFHAQLAHRLSLLPPASDPPSATDEKRREDCLDQFYADWQASNRQRMDDWVKRWWGEVWGGLRMQGRIIISSFLRR